MTRDPDRETWLDGVIDEVAAGMTQAVVPDLRSRVSERLDARHAGFHWWQAAAAATIALAIVWWNAGRTANVVAPRGPDSTIAAAPPVRHDPVAPPSPPSRPAETRVASRAITPRPAPRPWLIPDAREEGLQPAAPEPIQVEPLSHAVPEFVPVDISAIAVPAIVVEPLPRSML
jgi:hypothetical protein